LAVSGEPNSSRRLMSAPMASARRATPLTPIATYTSVSLLVTTPATSSPTATATRNALNLITGVPSPTPGAF
jgi:hypothetical protein